MGQAFEKAGQPIGEAEVFAVRGGVLPDQIDFADAPIEEARGFGDDGFQLAAAEPAAILRDHAEGARMVAAFRDFDVSEMARSGEHARREVVIQVGPGWNPRRFHAFAHGHDAIQVIGADNGIDLGDLLADGVAVAFHQATRHNQLAGSSALLEFGHLEDSLDRFLFGGVDETAGVDYQDIGFGGVRRQLVAPGHQLAHHDFTIDQVLGTAQADKADFVRAGHARRLLSVVRQGRHANGCVDCAGRVSPGVVANRTAAADARFSGSGLARFGFCPRGDVGQQVLAGESVLALLEGLEVGGQLSGTERGPSCMPTWCLRKSVRSTATMYRTAGARSTMLSNL